MKNKKLFFVYTNGYNVVVSVDENENCRYLTETDEFPSLDDCNEDEKKEKAEQFLQTIEDDSSWEDDCLYDEIFDEDVVILAEIQKEL